MKLFYQDSYLKEFTATVTDIVKEGDKIALVLDRTAFYPEGGGQPSDVGCIGDCTVIDVKDKKDQILHYIAKSDSLPAIGETLPGRIDWDKRFSNMQNHTGEHILSGLIYGKHGLDNVGFHMGSEDVTIDINGELSSDEITSLEQEANRIIWENRPNHILYPTKEQLSAMAYRSKKEIDGQIRIVEAGGVDRCACCGIHTTSTGEVGMLKILSAQRYKGGMRLSVLCGDRLFERVCMVMDCADRIGTMLSSKVSQIADNVEKLKSELADTKIQRDALQKELVAFKAKALLANGEDNILYAQEGITTQEARLFATALSERISGIAMVYSGTENGVYAIASQKVDIRSFTKELNQLTKGKGGGSPQLTQGSYMENGSGIPPLFHKISEEAVTPV